VSNGTAVFEVIHLGEIAAGTQAGTPAPSPAPKM
jgi:hypothetical protein